MKLLFNCLYACLLCLPLYVKGQTTTSPGNWLDAIWTPSAPSDPVGSNVVINHRVRSDVGITFGNVNGITLTVNDTLIIDGDLIFDENANNCNIVVNDDGAGNVGVLIVLGNVSLGKNNGSVTTVLNSVLATEGDFSSTGNTISYSGTGLYVGGTASNINNVANINDITPDLGNNGHGEIEDFVNSGGSTPLPVVLTSFRLSQEGRKVRIAWSTSSEQNTERFEIWRAGREQQFQRIVSRAAVGNSDVQQDYVAMDSAPLTGPNFYFLRSVDFDGYQESFDVHLLNVLLEYDRIYPNPTPDGLVYLPLSAGAEHTNVQVLDLQGRALLSETVDTSLRAPFQLELENGLYIIRLKTSGYEHIERLVVGQ